MHILTSFTAADNGANNTAQSVLSTSVVPFGDAEEVDAAAAALSNDTSSSWPSTVTVRPIAEERLQNAVDTGKAPILRLGELEAGAAEEAQGAVSVELVLNGGRSVHAGECAFLELRYRWAPGSTQEVRSLAFARVTTAPQLCCKTVSEWRTVFAAGLDTGAALRRRWPYLGGSCQCQCGGAAAPASASTLSRGRAQHEQPICGHLDTRRPRGARKPRSVCVCVHPWGAAAG